MASGSRTRIIAASVFAALGITLALATAAHFIVMSSFGALERELAAADIARAQGTLELRLNELARTAGDWGPWDDTYAFVETLDQEYVDDNLSPEGLVGLGLDYMIFVNAERRPVFAYGVDREAVKERPASAETLAALTGAEELLEFSDLRSTKSGLVRTPDGLYLVGAAPVTDSAWAAPARGALVVATRVDEAFVKDLGQRTQLDVNIRTEDELAGPARAAVTASAASDTAIDPVIPLPGGRSVTVDELTGLDGAPAAYLSVERARLIWQKGLQASRLLTGAVAVLALLGVSLTVGVVDRRLLRASRDELERAVAVRTTELAASESRFRGLVEEMADGLMAIDAGGRITYANPEAQRLLGTSAVGLVGLPASAVLGDDPALEGLGAEGSSRRAVEVQVFDAAAQPTLIEVVPTSGGGEGVRQWLVRDVTMRRRYEEQLIHLACHDHLTGLPNRRRFEEDLERELARAARQKTCGGVLWLDIDDFKEVNDTLGHRAGDELLMDVGAFLVAVTRAQDVVARIGGDEFAILLPESPHDEIEVAAQRVIQCFNTKRFQVGEKRLQISASVGAVEYPANGTLVEELLSRADIAMYAAKEEGKSQYRIWSPDTGDQSFVRTRLDWSERIRTALDTDTVVVFAQPIIDSMSGEILSYELLMRLPGDAPGELISPGEFLPVAERLGLIRDLDRWMVLRAIRLLTELPETVCVHVNLSGRAFGDHGLLELITSDVRRAGVDAKRLGFEITETAAIQDLARARTLITGLQRLGCELSLDDFGSGFASFYYLRNLPVDRLKIDGSFVKPLKDSASDRHLVRAIVELARALEVSTIAEYVEDEETLQIVRDLGVTMAQGYHIGRPAAVETLFTEDGPSA